MKKYIVLVICCLALSILAVSCRKADVADERARRAEKSAGEIQIAAVGAWSQDNDEAKAWNGMEMAVEEINKIGVIRGRKFHLIKKDDKGMVDASLLAAEEISGDPDIVAVIGHTSSFSTVPCSGIYESKGLLHISPIAKSPELLERNYKLFIDVQVKTGRAAKYLAEYARDKGYGQVAICYVYDDYGSRLATEFEKASARYGIKIIDSMPYWLEGTDSFDAVAAKWKNYDFDAILFVGHHEDTVAFITNVRRCGFNQPILTDSALDATAVARCGKYMNGVVTTSYFDIEPEELVAREFISAYRGKYGISPNRYSANGYEAVKLLAEGMRMAGSTAPAKVTTALRTLKEWQGISGKYGIGADGGITGKPVLLMEYRDGRFEKARGK